MSTGGEAPLMVRHNGQWEPLEVKKYTNEAELQGLLHETPSLLPGVSAGAAAVRELHVPGIGYIDLAVVDSDGVVTLVECKLQSNADIHRTVVGQVLAYAAGLWRLTYEDFDALFAACESKSIEVMIAERTGKEVDSTTFRSAVTRALADGAFRLFIAVDQVTHELRLIVEYLNIHTTNGIEIALYEVGIVSDGDVQILVPRVFGGESARLKTSTATSAPKWTIQEVLAEVSNLCGPTGAAVIQKLLDSALRSGWYAYPGKGATPSLTIHAKIGNKARALLTVYAHEGGVNDRCVTINFGSQRTLRSAETMDAFLTELEQQPDLVPFLGDARASDFDSYPIIPIAALAKPGVADAIAAAWANHLEDN